MIKSTVLLKDEFIVKDVDKEGKKFSSLSRIEFSSKNKEMDIILDINVDLFPIESSNYEFYIVESLNNGT